MIKASRERASKCLFSDREAIPVFQRFPVVCSAGELLVAPESVLLSRSLTVVVALVMTSSSSRLSLELPLGAVYLCLLVQWRFCKAWSGALPYVTVRGLASLAVNGASRPHLRCCGACGGQNIQTTVLQRLSGRYPSCSVGVPD